MNYIIKDKESKLYLGVDSLVEDIDNARVLTEKDKHCFQTELYEFIPVKLFIINDYDDTEEFKIYDKDTTPTKVISDLVKVVNSEFRSDGEMQSHPIKGRLTVTVEGLDDEFYLSGYETSYFFGCGCCSGIDLKVSKI